MGLSFGPSSSALVAACEELISNRAARNRDEPLELCVVHVDTALSPQAAPEPSPASRLLDRWRERYPRFRFEAVPLTSVLGLRTVDWTTLPPLKPDGEPVGKLRALLEDLPSTTSRADVLRLFVRHILVSLTMQKSQDALLLGCSTTALAELTLGETAKGRGFSLPWQINDGQVPVVYYSAGQGVPGESSSDVQPTGIPLYYPLRDVFRKELVMYGAMAEPPLADLIAEDVDKGNPVVSHKDLSIEEVVARYFEHVEENYPSVVASVVRTTARLDRLEEGARCGVCGMALDEKGEERWRGEIGGDRGGTQRRPPAGKLCYGCERSIHG